MGAPEVSARFTVATPGEMERLGRGLAGLLRAGDLLILTGDLGAGKTTLTRGLGAGLGVRGDVASPTFVIAREHRPLGAGPGLVHVDAYRLTSAAELDDLDLEASLDQAVTVVEWGEGLAESLADHRLEVRISRSRGEQFTGVDGEPPPPPTDQADPTLDDPRVVELIGHGERWADVRWADVRWADDRWADVRGADDRKADDRKADDRRAGVLLDP